MTKEEELKAEYVMTGHMRNCMSAALGFNHWRDNPQNAQECRDSFWTHYSQLGGNALTYVRTAIGTELLGELLKDEPRPSRAGFP